MIFYEEEQQVKVKKAVIPAAGLGTRFLPATKAMAKEMLPIVDKPTIQFIVEEALDSGIEDILIVTGKEKRPIEDHFDANIELENNLREKEKTELLALVEETTQVNLHFIRQSHPRGLGDAVLQAKAFIGNEPFVVMLGEQLMMDYEETQASAVAVMRVPENETSKYGIIDPKTDSEKGRCRVKGFVEKPEMGKAPSNLAIIGRYLLTPKIFEILETQEPGAGNEIQLTDALQTLNQTEAVYAREFKGKRYDVGDKLGYMKTNIEYGLQHSEIGTSLSAYIIQLSKKLRTES